MSKNFFQYPGIYRDGIAENKGFEPLSVIELT